MSRSTIAFAGLACAVLLATSACSSRDSELEEFIAATMKEPGGRVEPLPEVKPYESFTYAAQSLRSPFMPDSPKGRARSSSTRPVPSRGTPGEWRGSEAGISTGRSRT